jgi:hypothetical protein
MEAPLVSCAEDIEEEGVHIVIEGFVVQKQLCEVTQILTIESFNGSIHLEHRYLIISIDLVSRRVAKEMRFLLVSERG